MRSRFIKRITLFLLLCVATASMACAGTPPNKNSTPAVSESEESIGVNESGDDTSQDSLSSGGEESSMEENSSVEEVVPPNDEESSSKEESSGTGIEFPEVVIP